MSADRADRHPPRHLQPWQSKDGSRRRVYYDVTSEERSIVSKLYEVTAGDTRDATVVVEGRTFGYEFGIDTGSQTKRANAANAVERLAHMIVAH